MFNIQVDRRANKSTMVKGTHITPYMKLTEWNMPGLGRWPAVKAQGILTLGAQPSNGETFSIGSKIYTFLTILTNTDGAIQIGATLAQTQANVIAAINLTGVPGSQYAGITSLSQDVTAAAGIVANTIVLTAKNAGTAANTTALSKTMASGLNIFDGVTLGTARLGAVETDSDSILLPHYYGAFNVSVGQQYAHREMYYIGGSEYNNQDRPLGNNMDILRDFPENRAYLPAGATRKMYMPNHFERRIKTLKLLGMYTKKRTLEPVTLNSPFTAGTSNLVFKTIELDATRFIVFFRQASGTTGIYAVVGNAAADATITWGTPLSVQTRDMYNANFDACLISTDKVLIATDAPGSPFNINTAVLTISGTGITLNTPVQVAAIHSDYKRLVKIGTDKAILAYDNSNVTLVCVSVSGTVPSYGSLTTIASAQKGVMAPNGTDKAQLAYIGTGNNWYTAVVTASGTSLTVQTGIQLSYDASAGYGWKQVELLQLTTDKFIFYSDWSQVGFKSRDRYRFALITVASTTSTLVKAYYTFNSDGNNGYAGQIMMRAIDANNFYVWFGAYAFNTGTGVRGAKITIGTNNNINWPRTLQCGIGNPEIDGGKMLYSRQEFENIPQLGDIVSANGNWFFIGTDNYNNGNLCTFSDATFSFDLYNGDDKVGTYSKDQPFLIQPLSVNLTVLKEEFGIQIKSNDAYDRTMWIEHMETIID